MRLLPAILAVLLSVPAVHAQTGGLAEALAAIHEANTGCDPLGDLVNADDIVTGALDDSQTLYLVPCFAGAYNFGYAAYLGDTRYNEFRQLYFADYSETHGWTGTAQLFNPWYDPETRELGSFYKGRGLGDCGTTGLWRWTEYAFKLLQFTAKQECDAPEHPGDFPVIYTAPDYAPIPDMG